MLNKILKSFRIYCPFINVASDVSVNCERWQETEITRFLPRNLCMNSLASRSPAIVSFTELVIQTRLINKDKLVSTPVGQLRVPMIAKLLVAFPRLLCKL